MARSPQVLVLDNAIHPEAYRPFAHWRAAFPPEVPLRRALRDEPPPDLDGVTHLVVSGSEASIVDGDPWVAPQLDLIRRAAEAGIAVLGSCHGHQMVALAFGGRVGRAAEPELGWIEIEVEAADPMFAGLNARQWVFVSHFDEVTELTEDLQVTATTRRCAIHAIRHRELPVWGVQSHPEIDPAEGEAILADFGRLDPRVASARVDRPARDSKLIVPLVERFLSVGGTLQGK